MRSWGRWIYGMGFNERSARLVGIPVDRVRLAPMALVARSRLRRACERGWLGGAAHIGQNLRTDFANRGHARRHRIFGGKGGVFGVLAAVLLLVTLQQSLQLNVNTARQVGIVGTIL